MDTRVLRMTQDVIDAINEELAYVATLSDQGRSDTVHYGTAGQILTLAEYSQRAVQDWVANPGENYALHTLRKCAAIAIRALLTEGCPRRETRLSAKAVLGVVESGYAPEVGAGAGD